MVEVLHAVKYLDIEVLPDKRKEGGGEVDLALPVQRHVHPDQLLVGQPGRKKNIFGAQREAAKKEPPLVARPLGGMEEEGGGDKCN